MPFDITLRVELSDEDDTLLVNKLPTLLSAFTTAGNNRIGPHYQTVAAGATEAVALGDVAMGGLWVLWNTHATLVVDVQDAAGNHFAALQPRGAPMILPSDTTLVMTLNNPGGADATILCVGYSP